MRCGDRLISVRQIRRQYKIELKKTRSNKPGELH